MSTFLLALLLLLPSPIDQQGTTAPSTGDVQAGKTFWEGPMTQCRNCHGTNGEGAFGPDLAGRKLTVTQFRQGVRKPWGIMPAYLESQISDREIADLVAYFDTLPSVSQPGPWRFDVPAGAPHGQTVMLATVGCGQCHGVPFAFPRAVAGAVGADFEWFKSMVYDHTATMPKHFSLVEERPPARLRMGNYSRVRLPESLLQEIWNWARDQGFRAPVAGQLTAGTTAANGVTYTLTVTNGGLPGKGLTAEELTVSLTLPAGATVVATTGAGYKGLGKDEQAKAVTAEWQLPRLAPKERQTYTITLSRPGTAADNLRGVIRWTKPAIKSGPVDSVNIAPAPLAPPTQ